MQHVVCLFPSYFSLSLFLYFGFCSIVSIFIIIHQGVWVVIFFYFSLRNWLSDIVWSFCFTSLFLSSQLVYNAVLSSSVCHCDLFIDFFSTLIPLIRDFLLSFALNHSLTHTVKRSVTLFSLSAALSLRL